jgi:SAM-dependent methyltransferase
MVGMTAETYTPGHSQGATDFMAWRSLASHGEFFLAHLTPGVSVLDCGCGPGTITLGIADRAAPGWVTGIDFALSQVERASASAARAQVRNISFQVADCYCLPFGDDTFDRVFSHALLEHLSDPVRALRELHRVLKPGGVIGVCSPDWGGFLLAPPSPGVSEAVETYKALQCRNGGDIEVGRKLGAHLASAGFRAVHLSARYECYPSLELIGEYLASQLERGGETELAGALRNWICSESGLFAQAWVAATGQKA